MASDTQIATSGIRMDGLVELARRLAIGDAVSMLAIGGARGVPPAAWTGPLLLFRFSRTSGLASALDRVHSISAPSM